MKRIISFSGLDGCGKTTLIRQVKQEIESRGGSASYVWLRYNHYFTRVLHAFCRLAGYTRYEVKDGMRIGYHDFYRSRLVSWASVVLNLFDTFLASCWYVYRPLLVSRRAILCDRWVFDVIIDLAVDTRRPLEPMPWWGKVFLALIPRSAVCFLIVRDDNTLLESRPENVVDQNFGRRRALFEALRKQGRIVVILNNGTVRNSVDEILNHLETPGVPGLRLTDR